MSEENDPQAEETEQSEEPKTEETQQSEESKEEMSELTRVAHEVLHGGWSEGKDRQKLLIDAGHNPYEVEEEVNRLQSEKE